MTAQGPEQVLWSLFHGLELWPYWFRAICAGAGLACVCLLPKDPSRTIMVARWLLMVGLGLVAFSLFNSALLPWGDCIAYPAGVVWLIAILRRRWPEIVATRRREEEPADRQMFEFLFPRRR